MAPPKGKKPRRFTDNERATIVEMRLNGHTYTACCLALSPPGSHTCVKTVWTNWLADTSVERRAEMEAERTTVLAQLENVSSMALREATDIAAEIEPVDRARYMTVATRALSERSRIAGWDAPKVVQMSATVAMTEAEAAAILNEDDDT